LLASPCNNFKIQLMPIHPHPYLIAIGEDEILWRYVDLHKLISLLTEKRMFFCRADKYADPFECSTPLREFRYRQKVSMERSKNDPVEATKQVENMSSFFQRVKQATVINCWHINTNESDAMWRIYLKTNEGVAIQSNIARIKNAFNNTAENVYASKVRYIDYSKDIYHSIKEYPVNTVNTITPVIHKRKEFSHESEFRLFFEDQQASSDFTGKYWSTQENPLGKYFNIDVNQLIDRIVFSPTSDNVCKEKIKKIVSDLGYNFGFKDSALGQSPVY